MYSISLQLIKINIYPTKWDKRTKWHIWTKWRLSY